MVKAVVQRRDSRGVDLGTFPSPPPALSQSNARTSLGGLSGAPMGCRLAPPCLVCYLLWLSILTIPDVRLHVHSYVDGDAYP